MKKLFFLFVVLSTLVGFTSCGSDDDEIDGSSASSFTVEGIQSDESSADFMAKTKDGKTLYFKLQSPTTCYIVKSGKYQKTMIGRLEIPSHVSYLGEKLTIVGIDRSAFYSLEYLSEVIIPSTVEFISRYSFQSCNNIESIVLPNILNSLSSSAFTSCHSLKKVSYKGKTFTSKKELKINLIDSGVEIDGDEPFFSGTALSD